MTGGHNRRGVWRWLKSAYLVVKVLRRCDDWLVPICYSDLSKLTATYITIIINTAQTVKEKSKQFAHVPER